MNLYIIIPALLMAAAAISGMLYLYHWMSRYLDALRQNEMSIVEIGREYADKVEFLQRELFYAKKANSIRDPKTGRFISAEARLAQRMANRFPPIDLEKDRAVTKLLRDQGMIE